jgi:DNA-directed RNA polymerase specialized sigma24 family protein
MANYIDNSKFEELIQLFKTGSKDREEELFAMFDLLIDRLIMSFKFNVDHEEAKQECFLLILKVLKNFERESGQAFNYFTTVILNNLRLLYSKNKRYSEKLEAYKCHKSGNYMPSSAPTDPL